MVKKVSSIYTEGVRIWQVKLGNGHPEVYLHPRVWFGLVFISDTLKPKQYIFIYQFRHQFVSPDSETDMGRYTPDRATK